MSSTYDVRVYKTGVYSGSRTTTYYVRWNVAGRHRKKPFRTKAQADGFRSELVTATGKGEAFDTATGLPLSAHRAASGMPWVDFACRFVDMQWPRVAATTRRTHAEALTTVTVAMLLPGRGKPDDRAIRVALCRWAFNTVKRDACPNDVRDVLRWVQRNTRPVSSLASPDVLRGVLDALTVRLDGSPAAPSVVSRKRKILNRAVEYAAELGLLSSNPVPALKWRAPKSVHTVDRRVVANPVQARTLLDAVKEVSGGRRLVAFFGCLYFAALRPEEAAALTKSNLSLPAEGWGVLTLDGAEPYAGKDWTDSGENRDRRQLKQRARGEVRLVPCSPELTALLHGHLERFGTGADGRVFTGERNHNELPKLTIVRTWQRARQLAFTAEAAASPLAGTPYDLRHAAVSTWLNGGVPPTTVAEWAGHSVEVLLKTYAKCLDGTDTASRRRVQEALGHLPG